MTYLKPLPEISEQNRPFWDGLRVHEFRVPRCTGCGDYNWIPYPACRSCLSEDQEWVPVSGRAVVWSFSVVHRGPGAFNEEVPYVVVLAKLAEEPRSLIVTGNLIGVDPAEVKIGMPIQVVYEDVPQEDVTVYRFAPAT
ncbi:MAG: OB-fold domain-containing protein [Acidimicrobiaceae bacterium]|nr:OB-fold domain-containing protein [Acidimicrobiaceae bacterium]